MLLALYYCKVLINQLVDSLYFILSVLPLVSALSPCVRSARRL